MRTGLWLISSIFVIAVAGCVQQTHGRPDTIVFGSPLQPNSLNPITAPDLASRYAIEMLFDGLVAADDNLQIRGELATRWDVSPDGREWVFRLRSDIKWHDGEEFTADDVKFTYDTVIDPSSKPTVSKSDFSALQRVDVLDRYTVRFVLSRPDAAFLSRLVLGIAPKHLMLGQDLATSALNRHPVGTGPFRLESWSQGDSLVFRRNPDYFGAVPRIDRLVWKVIPDSNALSLQMLGGEIGGAPVPNLRDVPALRNSGKMAMYEALEGNTQISLQLKRPLFQDQRVRQALAYAIDTRALIDGVMQGSAIPATSDILPLSWAYNPDVATYPYDPSKAHALMSEAGWRPGADGVLTKEGRRFEFTLMTDAGHMGREQAMLAVRQYWSDLGMDVKASTQERNSFVTQRVLKGDFDAVLLQSAVQIDPDLSRRFHSGSITDGQNFVNYRNSAVDSLLEEGLRTTDLKARRRAYFEVQRIMAEDLPQISLYYPKSAYGFKLGIEGIKPSPLNMFWNAEEWRWR